MNKEETKQAIAVMQAFVDGKEIQYRSRYNSTWQPCRPSWNWIDNEYRIVPTKKKIEYRRLVTKDNNIIVIYKHKGDGQPDVIQNQSYFKEWIDTEWQVYEYEE